MEKPVLTTSSPFLHLDRAITAINDEYDRSLELKVLLPELCGGLYEQWNDYFKFIACEGFTYEELETFSSRMKVVVDEVLDAMLNKYPMDLICGRRPDLRHIVEGLEIVRGLNIRLDRLRKLG